MTLNLIETYLMDSISKTKDLPGKVLAAMVTEGVLCPLPLLDFTRKLYMVSAFSLSIFINV